MNLLIGAAMLTGSLVGEVTYYSDGVMEQVYRNRLTWGHVQPCPQCVGMVALLDRAHVGRRVWLQRPGRPPEGPFLVVDCAAAKDLARLQRRGLVAEVDRQTARRWRMAGPLYGVTVIFEEDYGRTKCLAGCHDRDGC